MEILKQISRYNSWRNSWVEFRKNLHMELMDNFSEAFHGFFKMELLEEFSGRILDDFSDGILEKILK